MPSRRSWRRGSTRSSSATWSRGTAADGRGYRPAPVLCANVVSAETPATLAAGVRVVIDALPARYGGAAVATIELAPRLAAHEAIAEVVVVTRRGSLVAAGLDGDAGVRVI